MTSLSVHWFKSHPILNSIFDSESYLKLAEKQRMLLLIRTGPAFSFLSSGAIKYGNRLSFPCFNSCFLIPVFIFETIWIQKDGFFLSTSDLFVGLLPAHPIRMSRDSLFFHFWNSHSRLSVSCENPQNLQCVYWSLTNCSFSLVIFCFKVSLGYCYVDLVHKIILW